MRFLPRTPALVSLVLGAFTACVAPCQAGFISGDGTLGHFEGTFTYSPTDATHATLTVALTNPSPPANGGFLTGFVFNNPTDDITGVTFTSSKSAFKLLGGTHFDNGINGAPYGVFDIGAALGGDFLGGGKPTDGIGVGKTATFVF